MALKVKVYNKKGEYKFTVNEMTAELVTKAQKYGWTLIKTVKG